MSDLLTLTLLSIGLASCLVMWTHAIENLTRPDNLTRPNLNLTSTHNLTCSNLNQTRKNTNMRHVSRNTFRVSQ